MKQFTEVWSNDRKIRCFTYAMCYGSYIVKYSRGVAHKNFVQWQDEAAGLQTTTLACTTWERFLEDHFTKQDAQVKLDAFRFRAGRDGFTKVGTFTLS